MQHALSIPRPRAAGTMTVLAAVAVGLGAFTAGANAAAETFNAEEPADNAATRAAWLAAAGVDEPQFLVDFESGFSPGQNISGQAGLFPGGLVIRDSSSAGEAIISGSSSDFGGSNPVGSLAVSHNEQQYLELDFSASPVDYVAFQDIDQAGTGGTITFVGGATQNFSLETTGASGDTAEFFGIWRADMPRITLVQLDASGDGGWGLDNIEYGLIPEPATAGTCLLLGGWFLARRRF